MAKVSFDGENKLIIILTGVTTIDVQLDMYSDWKEWVMMSDNAKWIAAFRTFGGDQTSESQFAPRYFFLINGWKVEATNVSVVVQTNLYSDDGLSPFIITNSAVTNRTSDVPVVKSELEQRLDYGDRIYFDENSIYTGTEYPNGTIAQPVNNPMSAVALANLYNINKFYTLSPINDSGLSGVTYSDYHFVGTKSGLVANIQNNIFDDVILENLVIDSNINNGTCTVVDCIIQNMYNVSGEMKRSQIIGTILIYEYIVLAACYSGVAGLGSPVIDMRENEDTTLSLRGYSGGAKILNCDTPNSKATLELIAGHIIIDETCTDGVIDIRGVGYLTDNSSGTTVITTGFVNSFGSYLDETSEINQILAYDNTLFYDEVNGVSGTTFPIGTYAQPVNNLLDLARLVVLETNIRSIVSKSDIVQLSGSPNDVTGLYIKAESNNLNIILNEGSRVYNNTVEGFKISQGDLDGNKNDIIECEIVELYNYSGNMKNSTISGLLTISGEATLTDCTSSTPDAIVRPTDDVSGSTSIIFNEYSGDITIDNIQDIDDEVTINLNSGKVTLTSGCTSGTIDIRGTGYLVDNSNGSTIITSGFITKQSLDLTELSSDIKRILGLTQENFRISNHVYDSEDKLESANVYTYTSSSDTINGINPLATYNMSAVYDTSGRLIDYKMTKN